MTVKTTPELTDVEMLEILKNIARNGSNAAARIAAITELRALRLEVERQRGVDVFARLYELPSPELQRSTPGD